MSRRIVPTDIRFGIMPRFRCIIGFELFAMQSNSRSTGTIGATILALISPRSTRRRISTNVNVLFRFHYYDPFAFTGQGLAWLLDGRYRYLTGLTWPYDADNAQAELANALGLIDQDPNLTPDQSAIFENELTADIAGYATSGTFTYLTAQLAKVQNWAQANDVNPSQILVGEYGVAQPSHNTLGDPLPTSPA